MPQIQTTGWKLPQAVIANGAVTGNQWNNPNNLLLVDGDVSESNPGAGVASDVTIGNYNLNLPQNAVVVGVELQLIGYRGAQTSPVITVSPNFLDNTDGSDVYYPYVTPFTGLTPDLATYILGTPDYQFATQFSVDQINNAKINLAANGDTYIDSCLMQVFYYIPATPTPPAPITADCADCDSMLEVPFMSLYAPMKIGDDFFILAPGSFTYANGQPVQPGDTGSCGGEIPFTIDPALRQTNGGNFQESMVVDTNNGGTWTVQQDGSILVQLASINDRGLLPYTPYTHNANFMSNHSASARVIITDNGRWTFSLLKKCQIGVLVSAPISVYAAGTLVANPVTKFNFEGAGQSTTQDGTDPEKVNIVIPGNGGTTPPQVVSTISGTSGNVQVSTLTENLEISGLNRGAIIEISTEEAQTVSSVLVGGVAATRAVQITDTPHNLRSEIWVCVNPPLGSQAVVVTLSGNAYLTFGAECVNGIDTAVPTGATQTATGTSLAPSLVLTTTRDYSLAIDSLTTAMAPILYTPGAGSALNWSQVAVGTTRQGGSAVQNAGLEPDAVTMDYSITQNTPWVYCAVEINGITAATPGVESVTGTYIDDTDPLNPVSKVPLNHTAATAPTVSDDNTLGYAIDSKWFDTATGILYTCTDASTGAAVWVTVSGTDSDQVKVDGSDTTPGYLDPKLNIHSSDASVTVVKTITNPAGDEVVDYDLTVIGGSSGGGAGSLIKAQAGGANIPVPGGTLGTENLIEIEVYLAKSGGSTSADSDIAITYGGSNICFFPDVTNSTDAYTSGVYLKAYIFGNGATNSQIGNGVILAMATPSGLPRLVYSPLTSNSAPAVDSTVSQDIGVTITNHSGATFVVTSMTVTAFKKGGSGNDTVPALAGNTFTGSTVPQPVIFGDGNGVSFFNMGTGSPFGSDSVGTATGIQKLTATFQVDANQVVMIDTLETWVVGISGSPIDQLRLSIQTVSGSDPTGTILASVALTPGTGNFYGGTLNTTLELTAGFYAFVIDRTGANSDTDHWTIGWNNNGGTNNAVYKYNGAWVNSGAQPEIRISMTYATDTAYLSAQSTGHRMESVIVNSGGGNSYKDTIPAILQTSLGFATTDQAIGDNMTVTVSGAVPGFGSLPLAPVNKYSVNSSDGTIAAGGGGNVVGRSLLTDTMLILPQ